MRLRVRVLGGQAPLWAVIASLVLPLVLAAALIAAAVSTRARRAPPASVAPLPAGAPAASSLASSAAPPPSGVSQLALNELEAKPESALTSEQVLARFAGRLEREISVAKGLRLNLEREPDAIKQKSMLLALRKLTTNPGTAAEALGAMASLPGPMGPDLLYEIWIGAGTKPETAELSRELLYCSDVRPKASPALAAALELRGAKTCDQAKSAVLLALEAGDRRSLAPLHKLRSKRGCGPSKKDDCYDCLREGDELKSSTAAVKKRRAPAPFAVP